MSRIKKTLVIMIAFVMVLSMTTTAFGADFGSTVLGEAATGDTGYGFVQSLRKSALLMTGSCSITKTKDYMICGWARTTTARAVEKVSYDLYYEKWDDAKSRWVTLNPVTPVINSNTNDLAVSGYHYTDPIGAGAYRVKVDHYAKDGTDFERLSNSSQYITFN